MLCPYARLVFGAFMTNEMSCSQSWRRPRRLHCLTDD